MIEIQEPTDITLRAERKLPFGALLPETFLHAGLDMDALLDCFGYACFDRETAKRKIFLAPITLRRGAACVEESLVSSSAANACFAMSSISLQAGGECHPPATDGAAGVRR